MPNKAAITIKDKRRLNDLLKSLKKAHGFKAIAEIEVSIEGIIKPEDYNVDSIQEILYEPEGDNIRKKIIKNYGLTQDAFDFNKSKRSNRHGKKNRIAFSRYCLAEKYAGLSDRGKVWLITDLMDEITEARERGEKLYGVIDFKTFRKQRKEEIDIEKARKQKEKEQRKKEREAKRAEKNKAKRNRADEGEEEEGEEEGEFQEEEEPEVEEPEEVVLKEEVAEKPKRAKKVKEIVIQIDLPIEDRIAELLTVPEVKEEYETPKKKELKTRIVHAGLTVTPQDIRSLLARYPDEPRARRAEKERRLKLGLNPDIVNVARKGQISRKRMIEERARYLLKEVMLKKHSGRAGEWIVENTSEPKSLPTYYKVVKKLLQKADELLTDEEYEKFMVGVVNNSVYGEWGPVDILTEEANDLILEFNNKYKTKAPRAAMVKFMNEFVDSLISPNLLNKAAKKNKARKPKKTGIHIRVRDPDHGLWHYYKRIKGDYIIQKEGEGRQWSWLDVGDLKQPGLQGLAFLVGFPKKPKDKFKPGDKIEPSRFMTQKIWIEKAMLGLPDKPTLKELESKVKKIYGTEIIAFLQKEHKAIVADFVIKSKDKDYQLNLDF